MEKYLLTMEFRYESIPKNENDFVNKSKMVTIGVFDNFNKACEKGNELLENLESKFELHKFPSGKKAKKERLGEELNFLGLGIRNNLVTNFAYLKTPFDFYLKVKTLKHEPVNNVIEYVVNSIEKYKDHKKSKEKDY